MTNQRKSDACSGVSSNSLPPLPIEICCTRPSICSIAFVRSDQKLFSFRAYTSYISRNPNSYLISAINGLDSSCNQELSLPAILLVRLAWLLYLSRTCRLFASSESEILGPFAKDYEPMISRPTIDRSRSYWIPCLGDLESLGFSNVFFTECGCMGQGASCFRVG